MQLHVTANVKKVPRCGENIRWSSGGGSSLPGRRSRNRSLLLVRGCWLLTVGRSKHGTLSNETLLLGEIKALRKKEKKKSKESQISAFV